MSARNWPMFNESAHCPKCLNDEVGVGYRRAGDAHLADRIRITDADKGDWLQRYCKRCQFSWPEEPLDRSAVAL